MSNSIPIGYCQCGCGQKTIVNPFNDRKAGYVKGVPRKYVRGHQFRKIRYTVDDQTGCWHWQGRINEQGYGLTSINGKNKVPAHRFIYERHKGVVPNGLELDHLCRVRDCVNPDHLEPVTHLENSRRGANSKLTVQTADEIRALYSTGQYSQRTLATRYGITQTTIWQVVSNGKWCRC